MPLKNTSFSYHCQTSIRSAGEETATICLCNNVITHIAQRPSPFLVFFFPGSAVPLNYVSYRIRVAGSFGSLLPQKKKNLVFIVITTVLVIIVTLITITVLPKLTLFWV